jgi:glycosyltransferase involved in cell wall biosynthesis
VRILIVSGIFHPDVGGPATYLYQLASTLSSDGHTVGVVAYGRATDQHDYPFRIWRVNRSGHPLLRLARFVYVLLRIGWRFPLWYVNDYGIPAALAGMIVQPRVVMKIVGDFAWEYARRNALTSDGIDVFQQKRYGVRIGLIKRLQRFYVCRADTVIVPSAYLGVLVAGWGVARERIRVIHNAVPPDAIDSPPGSHRCVGVVLTAARLTTWKGIDTLLQALLEVRKAVPEARLVVAGGGPERERLADLCGELGLHEQVTWLGDVSREVVLDWMHKASVFALLSQYEGFSHVLLEALAAGLPVVASTAGGNPELIRDGVDGTLVSPGNAAAASAAVVRLLTDPGFWLMRSTAARQRALEFAWPRLIDRTREVFESAGRRGSTT